MNDESCIKGTNGLFPITYFYLLELPTPPIRKHKEWKQGKEAMMEDSRKRDLDKWNVLAL